MTGWRYPAAALALGLMLASCGGGDDNGKTINAKGEGASLTMADPSGAGDGLGSVNLPRPAWLPDGFPLPADARIFITYAKDKQAPRLYMIQARTRARGGTVIDDFLGWAKANGLKARRLESANVKVNLASLEGDEENNANIQVLEREDGVSTIVLAVTGSPWPR